ncbi:MAG: radical SAM protein [Lachnospiraceae bacterium]|nr:radical SAM protein [Lachnospiraceae bacterium]
MKYIRLSKDYTLRGYKDYPYVLANRINGWTEILDRKTFLLLEMCSGMIDFCAVYLTKEQKNRLDSLQEKGIVQFLHRQDRIDTEQEYRRVDNCFIRSIHWSVTGRCNLKCRHCYMSAPDYKYKDMSTAECLRIIEQMDAAGVTSVSITGGEPFVRGDIWTILEAFSKKGIAVSHIYTNGMLLTEQILRRIQIMGLNPNFVISFDGVDGHDWLRAEKGAGEKAVGVIRMLKNCGFPVMIETAVYDGNIDCLTETYELLKSLEVDYWKTSLIYEAGEWRKEGRRTVTTGELYDAYLKIIFAYISDAAPCSIQLDGFFACPAHKPDRWYSPYVRRPRGEMKEAFCCATCRFDPYLLPNGRLLPCASMTDSEIEKNMPDLKDVTLGRLYRDADSAFFRVVNMKTSEFLAGNTECTRCEYREKCQGGCRAMSILEGFGLYGHSRILCTFFSEGYEDKIKKTVEHAERR